jgi:hypothetical protein
VLTYTILGKLIGMPLQGLGKCLEPIQSYCLLKELPALTSLVVDNTGKPGVGFIAAADVPAAQAKVFAHAWLDTHVPTVEELADAQTMLPSNGIASAATTSTGASGELPRD